jgi:mitogen-activated protein kinase 1/3
LIIEASLLWGLQAVDCTKFNNSTSQKLLQSSAEAEFFTEYGDASRYKIQEVIGKGSYGVVCSAIDVHTGEKVAIKKIHDIFEHISDAARILREIKLLRLLRHPDIVEIKHIMLPPSRRDFKDIYVVFELMESDLHQVIKANDDLTKEHYQFFLYQLLRALKYIHTGRGIVAVCLRDLHYLLGKYIRMVYEIMRSVVTWH